MKDIEYRIARALHKRNLLNNNMKYCTDHAASVIRQVGQIDILFELIKDMKGSDIIEILTSKEAKRIGTY